MAVSVFQEIIQLMQGPIAAFVENTQSGKKQALSSKQKAQTKPTDIITGLYLL